MPEEPLTPTFPQQYCLAIEVIKRVMKDTGGGGCSKISDNSKILVQQFITELLCFISSEAGSIMRQDGDCTLVGEHIIEACDQLGLEEYKPLACAFLYRYREEMKFVTATKKRKQAFD
eukprot:GHVR01124512.1.p1 GENE.GHVR01124512.1~~GHVR01124512.1.p1  ORF type:complete len:118 (+),score=24.63 GHVR01124512.1:37-390(+)